MTTAAMAHQVAQLYQGRCALHALAGGAWRRVGAGWCVLQLVQVQPGRYQLVGRDSTNAQSVRALLRGAGSARHGAPS